MEIFFVTRISGYKSIFLFSLSSFHKPPSDASDASQDLSIFLTKQGHGKKNCPTKKLSHVLGDFNVNCFNYHDDANENHLAITYLKKPPFLSSVVLHRSQKFLISQVLMIILNNRYLQQFSEEGYN